MSDKNFHLTRCDKLQQRKVFAFWKTCLQASVLQIAKVTSQQGKGLGGAACSLTFWWKMLLGLGFLASGQQIIEAL